MPDNSPQSEKPLFTGERLFSWQKKGSSTVYDAIQGKTIKKSEDGIEKDRYCTYCLSIKTHKEDTMSVNLYYIQRIGINLMTS